MDKGTAKYALLLKRARGALVGGDMSRIPLAPFPLVLRRKKNSFSGAKIGYISRFPEIRTRQYIFKVCPNVELYL